MNEGLVPFLYPALPQFPRSLAQPGVYDDYSGTGETKIKLVSLDEAEVIVVPIDWAFIEWNPAMRAVAMRFIESTRGSGKPIVCFFNHDRSEKLNAPPAVIAFRPSMMAPLRGAREFALPGFHTDCLREMAGGAIGEGSKPAIPTLGFCGMAKPPPSKLKATLRNGLTRLLPAGISRPMLLQETLVGHQYRWKILKSLEGSRRIKTSFVVRSQFFGGAAPKDYGEKWNLGALDKVRREYLDHMMESDYVLCIRGDGNGSIRFYEALCCGRIPVLVDTQCVMPLDFLIDWRKHCVWVDYSEAHRIEEIVADFHQRLSDSDYKALQAANRRVWEEYIRPDRFFGTLRRHLERAK